MNSKLFTLAVGVAFASNLSAGVFTIGGFKFDEKNTVTTASVVEGGPLRTHANTEFGRFSEAYITDPATRENTYAKFDRSKSVARLLGTKNRKGDYARHVSLPDSKDAPPWPNKERNVLQLGWGEGTGLKNGAGKDFVVFEVGTWEGFAVAVQKAGAKDFSPYRYQFFNTKDSLQDVNCVAFDLSDFGVADGEAITAVRIRNLYNSNATVGADKVENESGQGNIVAAGDSGYDKAFTLRQKPNGVEFPETGLGADIVYVTALHNVEAVEIPKTPAPTETAPPAEPATSSTNPVAPKK